MPSIDVAALLQARAGEELALNDRHMNPQLGRILHDLLDAVVDEPALNTRDQLLARAKERL